MGNTITLKDVEAAIKWLKMIQYITLLIYMTKKLQKMLTENTIRAKTMGQRLYVNAMKNNDLVFGIGPAGTGKTF